MTGMARTETPKRQRRTIRIAHLNHHQWARIAVADAVDRAKAQRLLDTENVIPSIEGCRFVLGKTYTFADRQWREVVEGEEPKFTVTQQVDQVELDTMGVEAHVSDAWQPNEGAE